MQEYVRVQTTDIVLRCRRPSTGFGHFLCKKCGSQEYEDLQLRYKAKQFHGNNFKQTNTSALTRKLDSVFRAPWARALYKCFGSYKTGNGNVHNAILISACTYMA